VFAFVDGGNDFTLNDEVGDRFATNIATTIVASHFVTQVVTVHHDQEGKRLSDIPCKFGNWNDKLIQIWPIQQPVVHWPPNGTFTNGGPEGIAYLMDRWRVGEQTDIISSGKALLIFYKQLTIAARIPHRMLRQERASPVDPERNIHVSRTELRRDACGGGPLRGSGGLCHHDAAY
jgi:hypothetical protein